MLEWLSSTLTGFGSTLCSAQLTTCASEWLILAVMGFATGVFGVLVGAGGGFILVPVLRIFFDKEVEIVAGTVLALVAANSISGAFAYRWMRIVDKRSAYLFAAAAIPGSVVAPFALKKALEQLPGIFDILFGLVLIALAARILTLQMRSSQQHTLARARRRRFVNPASLRRRRITAESGETYRYRFHEAYAVLVNFILGFISSFFGVGGGFLRTPILVYAFGFPVQVAVATSIFALAFYTTAGAAAHGFLGNIEWWPTFVFVGIGLVSGGQIGARLAGKVRGNLIIRLLMLLILAMGFQLIYQGIIR